MQGVTLYFDVNGANSTNTSGLLISGQMTSRVLISGLTADVNALLNSRGGTKIQGSVTPIAGQYVVFDFVAMSRPSINEIFCSKGSWANARLLYLRPLGINLSLIKGPVKMKHK